MSYREEKPWEEEEMPLSAPALPRRAKLPVISRLFSARQNGAAGTIDPLQLTAELQSRESATPQALARLAAGRMLSLLPLSTKAEPLALHLLLEALPLLKEQGFDALAIPLPIRNAARLGRALEHCDSERLAVELAVCGCRELAETQLRSLLKEVHNSGIEILPVDRRGGYRAAFIAARLASRLRGDGRSKVIFLSFAPRLAEESALYAAVQQRLATLLGEDVEKALAVLSREELAEVVTQAGCAFGSAGSASSHDGGALYRAAAAPMLRTLACRGRAEKLEALLAL